MQLNDELLALALANYAQLALRSCLVIFSLSLGRVSLLHPLHRPQGIGQKLNVRSSWRNSASRARRHEAYPVATELYAQV